MKKEKLVRFQVFVTPAQKKFLKRKGEASGGEKVREALREKYKI